MDGVLGLWVVYGACTELLTLPDRLKRPCGAAFKRFPGCDDRVLTAGAVGPRSVETFTFRRSPEKPLSLRQPRVVAHVWDTAHCRPGSLHLAQQVADLAHWADLPTRMYGDPCAHPVQKQQV